MPGLVEAHFHPTYFNVAALEDLDIKYPVEYVTLLAACNSRLGSSVDIRLLVVGGAYSTSMFGSSGRSRKISYLVPVSRRVVARFAVSVG